jgi:hypothetical protein
MDRAANTKRIVLERMLFDESVEPTDLPLSLLEYITDGFSDDKQIGRGGFAVVYKVCNILVSVGQATRYSCSKNLS